MGNMPRTQAPLLHQEVSVLGGRVALSPNPGEVVGFFCDGKGDAPAPDERGGAGIIVHLLHLLRDRDWCQDW